MNQDIVLTDEQRLIIDHVTGPILVLAPVGTGKTRVLAERLAKAVQQGVEPSKVLCLTFTNRAAEEMVERLRITYPEYVSKVMLRTFHGFCAHLLRSEARQVGLPADFLVYDEEDCAQLLREIAGGSLEEKDARRLCADLQDLKSRTGRERTRLDCAARELFSAHPQVDLAIRYQEALRSRHAVDFADLVYLARAALFADVQIAERWGKRFDFVQVDEMQDTHPAEYEVVSHLAKTSRNLAMIGDLDQTIYEWRGSAPQKVLETFRQEFEPIELPLTANHRATRILIRAASSFANSFEERYTQCRPAEECPEGELILFHRAPTEAHEAEWIADRIVELSMGKTDFAYNHTAVLTRTNDRSFQVYQTLERRGVPCVTVEQYHFFRRQEIKDALAYLKLLVNPRDAGAFHRMLLRPSRGIGPVTIDGILRDGEPTGLRLTDFAQPQTLLSGDPYSPLLTAVSGGRRLIVLDTETTGTTVEVDEIVEIAAEIQENGATREFHAYLENTVGVGDSVGVHGLTDEFLQENGRPVRATLAEFLAVAEGAILVGHNVGFDVKMIAAHARRLGLAVPDMQYADTLDIARRFLEAPDYRLETLSEWLNLTHRPSHRAAQDLKATRALLDLLLPLAQGTSTDRRAVVERYGKDFQQLAAMCDMWRKAVAQVRPADLLERILDESGLRRHYANDGKRTGNLGQLLRIFRERDDSSLAPETALRSLVEFSALARNVDHISRKDNRVLIITIHQAKGLEFENVFVAGASEGEMPSFYARRDGREEEERRLFYVAMTRAKRRLFISSHVQYRGREREVSPFVEAIGKEFIQRV